MAAVSVPVTSITRAGVAPTTPTPGDATNGHTMSNDGKSFLLVDNSGVASRTLTVAFSRTVDGQAVASRVYTLASGVDRYIGPFPQSDYGTTLSFTVSHAELLLSAYRLSDN